MLWIHTKETKKEAVENLSKEIDILKEKLDETLDEKLRALAELENIRRRMQKEKEENAKYGAAYIAKGISEILLIKGMVRLALGETSNT